MPRISWSGEDLLLLPEKAVFWQRCRTLLLADPHFGKAAAFRSAGIAVPAGTTRGDLARLERLVQHYPVKRIIVLGDLLHDRAGRSTGMAAAFSQWRQRCAHIQVLLVRGNHDLRAGDPCPEWDLEAVSEPLAEPPFLFCHDPSPRSGGAVIGGHVHPAAVLEGPAGERLRLPCFCFGLRRAILPAFGSFTGCHSLRAQPGDRLFVVAEGEVIEATISP